jgi:hypothetical protein
LASHSNRTSGNGSAKSRRYATIASRPGEPTLVGGHDNGAVGVALSCGREILCFELGRAELKELSWANAVGPSEAVTNTPARLQSSQIAGLFCGADVEAPALRLS